MFGLQAQCRITFDHEATLKEQGIRFGSARGQEQQARGIGPNGGVGFATRVDDSGGWRVQAEPPLDPELADCDCQGTAGQKIHETVVDLTGQNAAQGAGSGFSRTDLPAT